MDQFLQEINSSIYQQWILQQSIDGFLIKHDEKTITFYNDYCIGEIIKNPQSIFELQITQKSTQEIKFYIHFQMHHLKHGIELFQEMVELMKDFQENETIKVLLCCSGGLTTSYFATLLNDACQILSEPIHIDAAPYTKLYQLENQYHMILLAPQISYILSSVQTALANHKIYSIPTSYFACYDVKNTIHFIKEHLNTNKNTTTETKPIYNTSFDKSILCLSLYSDNDNYHITYQIYDSTVDEYYDNKIMKKTLNITDFYDIIDTVLARIASIDTIGISLPTLVNDKTIDPDFINGIDQQLYDALSAKYSQKIIIANDANCAALGYYHLIDPVKSFMFIFQPINNYAGTGRIENSKIMGGHHQLAGELQYLPLPLSKDARELSCTIEGTMELLTQIILSIISIVSPHSIAIYAKLLLDVPGLIENLKKKIPEKYIPEIIKVDDLSEYVLYGLFLQCK